MKILFQLLFVLLALQSCSDPSKFAEFYVDDVSKEQIFIDSITGTGFNLLGGHVALEVFMEGELDSSADVSFYYYPSNERAWTWDLRKEDNLTLKKNGTIPFHTRKLDFYGDTLLIRYIPKGATKGRLKIRTNVR